MDKISDLKQIVIKTLDINKAQDIISIDLKDKSSILTTWLLQANIFKTYSSFIWTSFRKIKRHGVKNSKKRERK